MKRDCFNLLCQRIIVCVGEAKFKSEAYIDAFLKGKDQMYDANVKTTGGYIAGEVKVAITLRLLGGGDALDLAVIFDIEPCHCRKIMFDVLQNWVIKGDIGDLKMLEYLGDERAMAKVSHGFAKRSGGILVGAIGALDGWVVRIVRPGWIDAIKNPMSFFSRKGFYALNVQCIVDDKKRVIWASYSHKGGSHDSSCFKETKLYQKLINMQDRLLQLGYFILGDSAYSTRSFLLVPYDSASPYTSEDDFNFYHSSARITVECAFGEIDLRWGIFWKRLTCSLDNSALIVEGAMRIHNYLVDYREANNCKSEAQIDKYIFEQGCDDTGAASMVVGNDVFNIRGRPTNVEKDERLNALKLRDTLRMSLKDHGMR